MKRTFFIFLLFIVSLASFAEAPQSQAYIAAKQFAVDKGYTIVEDKYAYIAQGGTMFNYRMCYPTLEYLVFGMSQDGDVQDVDVAIYYSATGELLANDNDSEDCAAVSFSPVIATTIKIVLTNYKSLTPLDRSLCRYFVAYK